MTILRAKILNRKASDPRCKPGQIIRAISVKPGMHIADIGSGGGYFSMRFSGIVGNEGRVYAVDTNKTYLNVIDSSASKNGLKNIITVLSNGQGMEIPENSIDCIFMRNVVHHIPDRSGYFKKLKKYLKPAGRVAIVDYKKNRKKMFRKPPSHYISREALVKKLTEDGYLIEEEFDFLPEQNFIIFAPEQ